MTDRYFDSVSGNDANDGLTPATAKQVYNPAAGADGDRFLFKRGTTQVVTVTNQWVRNGVSATARTYYGAYGEASVPYSTWTYAAASGNMILNCAKTHWTDFEDMYFDMRGANCRNSLYIASQTTFPAYSINIRRCFFRGSNWPTTRGGNGLNIVQEITSTVYPYDITIEDCEFFENEGHGLFILGSRDIKVRRCTFHHNGQFDPTGGHGFSSRYNYTVATSGWTNTAGTVWQKTLGAVEFDVYYVATTVAAYLKLRRTAGTATSPGIGEFGVSAGVVYMNVNSASNPSTQGVYYAWGRCCQLTIEDCESYSNYWNVSAPFHEGHGFAFDDWADDSVFRRNKSYNNQGCGFSINRGDRNKIIGNIAYGNWQGAVVMNPQDNLEVVNNTFYGNNAGTGANTGEIHSWGYSRNAIITNNILTSTVAYGVTSESTDTGFTGAKNAITGATTAVEKTPFLTGTIAIAPALDADYRPTAAALIRTGSYLGHRDYNGKQFYNPPNIGAVDDITLYPRYGLRPE
jgi:parallel beta-helix repeat protein